MTLTLLASLTLLPALLGFAGPRVEVTRRRGLIAAGLIAIGLVGVGVGVPALALVVAAGRGHRAARQLRRRSARKPVPQRQPKPLPVTVRYRWSRDPAPSLDGGRRWYGHPGRVRHPLVRPAARVLRRGQLPGTDHHPRGLRPAGRGLRPRVQRAARAGERGSCRHRRGGARPPWPTPSARTLAWRWSARRSRTTRPPRPP